MNSEKQASFGILTPGGILVDGCLPDGYKDDPEFLSLLEQVRFFNGDLAVLAEQEKPFHWLTANYARKRDFFLKKLFKIRQCDNADIEGLTKRVQASASLLDEVLEKYYVDFTKFGENQDAWEQEIGHDIREDEIAGALKLAKIVKEICDKWPTTTSDDKVTNYIKSNNLPLLIQVGFREFVEMANRLADLKGMIDKETESIGTLLRDNAKYELGNKVFPDSADYTDLRLEGTISAVNSRQFEVKRPLSAECKSSIYIGAELQLPDDKTCRIKELEYQNDMLVVTIDDNLESSNGKIQAKAQTKLLESCRITPLGYAAAMHCNTAVTVLLDAQADFDIADDKGRKPIHLAAMYGNIDAVLELVKRGASLFEEDNDRKSAFDYVKATHTQKKLGKVLKELIEQAISSDNVADFRSLTTDNKDLLTWAYKYEGVDYPLAMYAIAHGSSKCLASILGKSYPQEQLYLPENKSCNVFSVFKDFRQKNQSAEEKLLSMAKTLLTLPISFFDENGLYGQANVTADNNPLFQEVEAHKALLLYCERIINGKDNDAITKFIAGHPELINSYMKDGLTPLLAMIKTLDEDYVLSLLDDKNLKLELDRKGIADENKDKTALNLAAARNSQKLIEKLGGAKILEYIEKNAWPELREFLKEHPLLIMSSFNGENVANLLLKKAPEIFDDTVLQLSSDLSTEEGLQYKTFKEQVQDELGTWKAGNKQYTYSEFLSVDSENFYKLLFYALANDKRDSQSSIAAAIQAMANDLQTALENNVITPLISQYRDASRNYFVDRACKKSALEKVEVQKGAIDTSAVNKEVCEEVEKMVAEEIETVEDRVFAEAQKLGVAQNKSFNPMFKLRVERNLFDENGQLGKDNTLKRVLFDLGMT